MKNIKTRGDFSKIDNPNSTMCVDEFFDSAALEYLPMPKVTFCSNPAPTRICFDRFFGDSFSEIGEVLPKIDAFWHELLPIELKANYMELHT